MALLKEDGKRTLSHVVPERLVRLHSTTLPLF